MKRSSVSIGILFVCTGNICRSSTAEAVFRYLATKDGFSDAFDIGSAGTHGYHIGDPPDSRSIHVALSKGVDMRGQRARRFEKEDFARYQYILAMDSGHYTHLDKARQGGVEEGALEMFLSFPNKINNLLDVPDPYYNDHKAFETVYDLIESQCRELLFFLKARHGLK